MVKKSVNLEAIVRTRSTIERTWGFIAWMVGVIVSLAVGFGLISKTLYVPFIFPLITVLAGWFVVILTLIGAILALIDKFSKK